MTEIITWLSANWFQIGVLVGGTYVAIRFGTTRAWKDSSDGYKSQKEMLESKLEMERENWAEKERRWEDKLSAETALREQGQQSTAERVTHLEEMVRLLQHDKEELQKLVSMRDTVPAPLAELMNTFASKTITVNLERFDKLEAKLDGVEKALAGKVDM